jgi:hypothetical protein
MFTDPSRIADAINNPRFHPGDHVVFVEGPLKYTRGTFLSLRADVEWANIRESSGALSTHPVAWMRSDPERNVEQTHPWEEENPMKQIAINDVPAAEKPSMAPGDRFSPTQDEVAVLADEFWKQRGRPLGSPDEDWLRAEGAIKHSRTPGSVL